MDKLALYQLSITDNNPPYFMNQFIDYDFEEWKNVERKVLSSLIFYYSQIVETQDIESIPVDYFFTKEAQLIFKTLLETPIVNDSFDMSVLCNSLKSKCKNTQLLDSTHEYVKGLEKDFQYFNIDVHLSILHQNYVKTQLNQLSNEILKTHLSSNNFHDVVSKWEYNFLRITSQDKIFNFLTSKEVLTQYEKNKRELEDNQKILKSNYTFLDQKIQGFCPGQLLVIASRPGIGKTTFALNLINQNLGNIRKLGFKREPAIGIFSLEMKNETLMEKLISINSNIPIETIRSCKTIESLNTHQQTLYNNTKNEIISANLLFCDSESITLGKLVATIKMWCRQDDIKLIIIDYLQLINMPHDKDFVNLSSYQKIGMISRHLKILSLELKICIVALAQLNRKAEERRGGGAPILSDLRESGSIEQDADIVMFLYQNKKKDDLFDDDAPPSDTSKIDEISLMIGKNRHGPIGQVDFIFHKDKGIFKINLDQ